MSEVHRVLIGGEWRPAAAVGTFQAHNPATKETLADVYPVSGWEDVDATLSAAWQAAEELRADAGVGARVAGFLEGYARLIESRAGALAEAAHLETALPVSPRLKDVELVRTVNQLRLAAEAAREGTWRRPRIDTKAGGGGLRSCYAPIGPVWVIGPNNFPFAYNGISGGDFAAAMAAGNPVIAKAHPLHPTTSRLLAEAAHEAATIAGLPAGTVQMVYHLPAEVGLKFAGDGRLRAIGFTGSRMGGLALKGAAEAAGKLFFGEMSSLNPVVILPGALVENAAGIAEQLTASVTLGTGQFCTKPGLVFLSQSASAMSFVDALRSKLAAATAGALFSAAGQENLLHAIGALQAAGAELLLGGKANDIAGYGVTTALLQTTGSRFLENPRAFQTEAFGNATLLVIFKDLEELLNALRTLDGNLTGSIYSAAGGPDEQTYAAVAAILRPRVGRLLNDKMPTGVAVSEAMNHGGPYPATTQPHFTAVGFPAAIERFTQLESYDNVRPERLPACLRDKNPTGRMWRSVDGQWTQGDV